MVAKSPKILLNKDVMHFVRFRYYYLITCSKSNILPSCHKFYILLNHLLLKIFFQEISLSQKCFENEDFMWECRGRYENNHYHQHTKHLQFDWLMNTKYFAYLKAAYFSSILIGCQLKLC